MPKPTDTDTYISGFPTETQLRLQQIRKTIQQTVPEAKEAFSYNMPAFKLNGILVWYAAYKNHIGFYPKSAAIVSFAQELSTYKHAKGSIQFPLKQALPIELIVKIVKFRVDEDKALSR